MAQDKKFLKLKNVLDATYQKYLNYFNISAISLITTIFSLAVGHLSKAIPQQVMFSSVIFSILIFGSALAFSYAKMNKTLDKIKEL